MPATEHTPHSERSEDVNLDPSTGYHKAIYDNLLLFGPLDDEDIVYRRNGVSIPIQASFDTAWYLEEHPDETRPREEIADEAIGWALQREIDHGLKRGWFVRTGDGLLDHGDVPPQHKPLDTFGGREKAKARLQSADRQRLREIMDAKSNPTRMRRIGYRVKALEKSMKQRTEWGLGHPSGQAYPIITWGEFIVDGQTRLEIQERRGVEPWFRELEGAGHAEALWARVDHEMNATTKDQSKEARDEYIAELGETGMRQSEIADRVGLSQQRVNQILSTYKSTSTVDKEPTPEEIDEFETFADDGWTVRAIAAETRWSKSVISKHLKIRREGVTEDDRVEPGSDRDLILQAYADAGDEGLTDDEVEAITGMSHGKVSGNGGRSKLEKDGLVSKTGMTRATKSGKRAMARAITEEGEQVNANNDALRPMAEADAGPPDELPLGDLPTGLVAELRRWDVDVNDEVIDVIKRNRRLPDARMV